MPSAAASASLGRSRGRWHVYVLRCGDGTLYTGATNDLPARVARHASGKGARYTRSRLPVVLVHAERCGDRSGALRREAALKRLTRAEKLALVAAGAGRRRAGPRAGRADVREPAPARAARRCRPRGRG